MGQRRKLGWGQPRLGRHKQLKGRSDAAHHQTDGRVHYHQRYNSSENYRRQGWARQTWLRVSRGEHHLPGGTLPKDSRREPARSYNLHRPGEAGRFSTQTLGQQTKAEKRRFQLDQRMIVNSDELLDTWLLPEAVVPANLWHHTQPVSYTDDFTD